ncbi:MAG: leucine-rich repeat domain-containing protein [Bacteroidota bacterium]
MKFTGAIYFFFFFTLSYGQVTSIPDTIFEQALIDLGYDSGSTDGQVFTDSINSIVDLDISWLDISDLTGIEDFNALEELNCTMNSIDTLDFSSNPNLKKLICRGNQAVYLNVTQNSNLEWLECGSNNLQSVDLSQNNLLERLYANFAGLNSLDVSNNLNLIYLHVSFNQLTSVDITNCSNIISFTCQSNELTSLDLTQNSWLQYFKCQNNLIEDIDFTNCSSLRDVYCGNNLLTTLDFSQNENLKYVRCENNNLKCLNLKNGYPYELDLLIATGNPNLNCIEVDDSTWATSNYSQVDHVSSFSQDCYNDCLVAGIDEFQTESRNIRRIIDMMGKETVDRTNTLLIFIYSDGTSEKVFRTE